MSESELLFSFLIGLMIVAVVAMGLSVLQWKRINHEAVVEKKVRQLRGKNQPNVTILLYAKNRQDDIVDALRALRGGRYRHYDVVVIDDASMDQTSQRVREYLLRYSKAPFQLLRRRTETSEHQALLAGYRKSQRGSIIITLTPDLITGKGFIKRAIASKQEKPHWTVSVGEKLGTELRISEIGTTLARYFWQHDTHADVYDAKYFLEKQRALSAPQDLTYLRDSVGVLVLALLFIVSFLILGVQTFWYAWIIVSTYGLVAIWLRYGESLRDRLVLSLSIPLALFLIPATSLMRGISQLSSRK